LKNFVDGLSRGKPFEPDDPKQARAELRSGDQMPGVGLRQQFGVFGDIDRAEGREGCLGPSLRGG
jgi:hypothetical protein